jgi:hypothetical protein
MGASRFIKIGASALVALGLIFGNIAPAAFADDAPDATTQPVVTADTSPSTDTAPAASTIAVETPKPVATPVVSAKTEAPTTPVAPTDDLKKAPAADKSPPVKETVKLVAGKDEPLLCTDLTKGLGYQDKVDTIGDPATVTYTAPSGFLVDAYCVKAGTEPIIVSVNPPAATVIIDHPNKDSVSHYQVHLVAIAVVPTCVSTPNYSYTFDSATGSGDITVTGGAAGATLCKPLAVRAVAWSYDLPASGSPSFPQTQIGHNDSTVDKIGTFHYGPPQVATCRQYDAYASFDGFGALAVPEHLLGSHNPYEPAFLSETLKGKGPNPTYSMTTSEGCNPPPPTPKVCTTIATGPVATNMDEAGWNHHDTGSTGAYEYVNGGIRLHTTDTSNPGSSQNKVTLYRSITPTPLSEFGEPSVTFADGGTGTRPGMQVGVDVNGDGTWDGYLVGEPWSYGAHNWWVNKPGFNVPSQFGYTSGGSWADFVAANPKAKVIELGLSMGSGVVGDWTVTNLTAGCTSYMFDYVAPVIKPVATISSGACYYNAEQDLSFKPISLTFDNTASNKPVEFVVSAPYGDLSRTVPAGESVTVQGQDGSQDGVGYVVTAGGKTFELNIPAFDSCVPITYVTPVNVKFADSTVCNVPGSYSIEGATLNPEGTFTDAKTGFLYTEQDSEQGTYYIEDATTDGVRTVTVDFYLAGAVEIAEPGVNDSYKIIRLEGQTYAEWTHTFTKVEVCPTEPPVVIPPVVTPPVVVPPAVTPPTTTTATTTVKKSDSLAFTGADIGAGGLIGLLLVVAGFGGVIFTKIRLRKVTK